MISSFRNKGFWLSLINSLYFGKLRLIPAILLVVFSAKIVLSHIGSHEEIEIVRKESEEDPSNQELGLRYAILLRECEHFEKSLTELNELIGLDSDTGSYYYQRALTYKHMGRYILAERDFSQALALGGPQNAIHIERARVRDHLGQYQAAREDYDTASEFDQPPNFYLERGSFLIRLNDLDSAVTNYKQGLERTGSLAILEHYIRLECQRHNYVQALSLVESAIEPHRFNARWLLMKAEVYEKKGDLIKANKVRLKALYECEQWKMSRRYTNLHRVYHADVMLALGRLEEAETEIKGIMEFSPELIQAKAVKEKIDLIRMTNSKQK